MNQIHRNTPPSSEPISHIDFLPIKKFKLSNGLTVHLVEGGSQEVTKIDLIFPAGSVQAAQPLLASTTNKLLSEGTSSLTSEQISEKIDFFGAYLGQQTNYHHAVVSLFTLSKHLEPTCELLSQIIKDPVFPQHELDLYLDKRKQEYEIEGQKVKTMATRKFTTTLYGKEHPYGNHLKPEHFSEITREDLIKFHKKVYIPKGSHMIISGQPGAPLESILSKYFSDTWQPGKYSDHFTAFALPDTPLTIFEKKENAVQSAIKIGRPLFTKNHPDYLPVQILNTILGGYFGSRLMTNLREEKGLTYGISSYIMSFKHSGFWVIGTEVKGEDRETAIKEIFHEINRLRTEMVSAEELSLIKNYMLGDLTRNFDGPFSLADNYRSLLDFSLDMRFFQKFFDTIRQITAEELLTLADKYLKEEDFITIIAGK